MVLVIKKIITYITSKHRVKKQKIERLKLYKAKQSKNKREKECSF